MIFKNTLIAYKLFKTKNGKLYPLFVNSDTEIPIGIWLKAKSGPRDKNGRVKSKLGGLAFRPGWHAAEYPVATHIGGKSTKFTNKPDFRPDNQVWCKVLLPDDTDWQSIANSRATVGKNGKMIVRTAHIVNEIPFGGNYRYKTNPNMIGTWIISGNMKVLKILSDNDVYNINAEIGIHDLPRISQL